MHPLRRSLFALLPLALLSACGGGGGGGSAGAPPAPVALTLTATNPADGAVDVARSATLEASFSTAPQLASIDSKSAQLVGPEGDVIPLVAELNGSRVSFKPLAGALPGATRYTFTLSSAINSPAAVGLSGARPVSFTTAPQQWETAPQQITKLPDESPAAPWLASESGWAAPWVVGDAAGNVTAIWQAKDPKRFAIYASRQADGETGWTAPVKLYTPVPETRIGGVSTLADARGNVFVTWVRDASTSQDWIVEAMFTRYDAASRQWTPAATFPSTLGYPPAAAPQLVLGADGVVTALTLGLLRQEIAATRFEPATGKWGTPVAVVQSDQGNLDMPTVAGDGKGNLMAAWTQNLNERGLYTVRFDAATARWSPPVLVEPSRFSSQVVISGHEAGGFTMVWSDTEVYAARMGPGQSAWSPTRTISAATDRWVDLPKVVVSPAGVATAVYDTADGIRAARSAAGATTWTALPPPVPGSIPYSDAHTLGVDGAGNASILWSDEGLHMATYSSLSGEWRISAAGAGLTSTPIDAMTAKHIVHRNGDITAVWTEAPPGNRGYGVLLTGAVLGSKRYR